MAKQSSKEKISIPKWLSVSKSLRERLEADPEEMRRFVKKETEFGNALLENLKRNVEREERGEQVVT